MASEGLRMIELIGGNVTSEFFVKIRCDVFNALYCVENPRKDLKMTLKMKPWI